MNEIKTYIGTHDYFATGEGREIFWYLIRVEENEDIEKIFYKKLCKISNKKYSTKWFKQVKLGFVFYDISDKRDLKQFQFDHQNELDDVGFDEIENIWKIHKRFGNVPQEFIKYRFLNIS
jgi:hypothetical protein